jgi:hypothetical protein
MPPFNFPGGLSPAGSALGLGDALAGQVSDATEELRKKRQLEAQQRALLGVSGGSAGGSVFGGFNGTGLLR